MKRSPIWSDLVRDHGAHLDSMRSGRRHFLRLAVAGALLGPQTVSAQSGRPLKVVVPYGPGGSVDVVMRGLGERLTRKTGRPVILDNKGGAGGSIGASVVARANPDGDTLLMHTGTIAVEYAAGKSVPYDLKEDFAPVSMVGAGPFALIVTPSLKVNNVQDLIDMAKANPGKLNYASSGAGTSVHLAMELFKSMAGVDIVHVPYKGSGASLTALIAGEIDMMINPLVTAKTFSSDGRVRTLAVSSLNRTPLWPEMPTLNESGVPGYESSVWYGLSAPGKTPAAVVNDLSKNIQEVVAMPDTQQWLMSIGLEPVGNNPAAFRKQIDREVEIWRKLIKDANLTLY